MKKPDTIEIIGVGLASTMTPGPNNIMLLSSGLTFGYKRTIPHALGVNFGFPLMVICVGMGIGKLFLRSGMHKYRLTPSAKSDLIAIWNYTVETWDEKQAVLESTTTA